MADLPQPGFLFSAGMMILLISVLVTVHEFGHYIVGRLFGVKVLTFSVGMGPELFHWHDKRGTRWRIGVLPIGGYCKFLGDMDATSRPDNAAHVLPASEKAQAFPFKPLWQRFLIVFAGPGINLLFAVLIFWTAFMIKGVPYADPVVGQVMAQSAAAKAGFMAGDRLVKADGRSIHSFDDIIPVVARSANQSVEFIVNRGGIEKTLTATPGVFQEKDRFGVVHSYGRLGIAGGVPKLEKRGPIDTLGAAVRACMRAVDDALANLWKMLSGRVSINEIGGPGKIGEAAGIAASLGWFSFINLMALISISLAVMNLLPVPVLDGGHLALYAAEAVRGKPLNPKVLEMAFSAGFFLIAGLMLFLFWNDLRLFGVWRELAGLWS
jgi:regulator of sigma E protease